MDLSDVFSSMSDSPFPTMGLLSRCAGHLRRSLPRRSHRSGTILYPQSFTVHDLRSTVESCVSADSRTHDKERILEVATAIMRSLELQSLFYVVNWKEMVFAADDDVCMFLYYEEEEEPPTGVFPGLTRCYSPTCQESDPCYSPSCPRRMKLPSVDPPHTSSSNIIFKCYSPTCEHETGCYSPTCPRHSSNAENIHYFSSRESSSSCEPLTPSDEHCTTGTCDWSEPLESAERPRRSLSFYLTDLPTESVLADFWIYTSDPRGGSV